MSDFTTHKAALKAALTGTDPETAKAIIEWLDTPPAKQGPQPADDDTIIISRPH